MAATAQARLAAGLELDELSLGADGRPEDWLIGQFARFGMLGEDLVADANLLDFAGTFERPNHGSRGQAFVAEGRGAAGAQAATGAARADRDAIGDRHQRRL